VLVALGIAQSLHALPPAQFPDRWLELVGGIFMLVGIGLTALAGRSGQPFIIPATAQAPVTAPNVGFSINVTKSTKSIGVAEAGIISTVLSKVVDKSSDAMIAGMLADLDDPSKASNIHIEGVDPGQVKDELRRLLSRDTSTDPVDTAGSSIADPRPDTSFDARSSQLRELDDLHAAGLLNDEQYQAARAKLPG
jgi:hypothetical protein